MSTVMSWHNSEGCVGRCDDKCHSAKHPTCDCMCGGLYHGSKRHGVFEKIQEAHGEAILADAKLRAAAEGFVLVPAGGSLPLFENLPVDATPPAQPKPPRGKKCPKATTRSRSTSSRS